MTFAKRLKAKTSKSKNKARAVSATVLALWFSSVAAAVPPASSNPAASNLAHDPRMVMWRQTFLWAVVILIIFVAAVAAIIRFTQRFRSLILTGPSEPTPSDDVWAMHKPPEKLEFSDDEPA